MERNSYIKRPKVANISQIIFVISAKMPKPNLLILDKELAFAEFSNIKPIIVINKIDLDKEVAETLYNTYKKVRI
ncbi:MAG: GTPase RsgA [Clostridia bacterium]|nr:GTPase RsgA [Clostridia bacterium]